MGGKPGGVSEDKQANPAPSCPRLCIFSSSRYICRSAVPGFELRGAMGVFLRKIRASPHSCFRGSLMLKNPSTKVQTPARNWVFFKNINGKSCSGYGGEKGKEEFSVGVWRL